MSHMRFRLVKSYRSETAVWHCIIPVFYGAPQVNLDEDRLTQSATQILPRDSCFFQYNVYANIREVPYGKTVSTCTWDWRGPSSAGRKRRF